MRVYVSEISSDLEGSNVTVSGWVHEVRDHGKIRFLILRDQSGLIQMVGKKGNVSDEVYDKLSLPKETVITVKGVIKSEKQAPGGVEINPLSIEVLNEVTILLPVDPTDKIISELDTRLDNRHIDLRRRKIHSIFHIQSKILAAFREKVVAMNFEEMVPPTLCGTATEGGSEVFPVVYFDKEAFLVQSPQLYKQLAIIGGMEKVFITTPVFRAEKHKTTAHLNQALQMDIEMAFADHNDAIKVLKDVFIHMVNKIADTCKPQLDAIGTTLDKIDSIPTYEYTEVIDKLNEHGMKIEWGKDFGREEERKLNEIMGKKAIVITGYPTAVRAFYSMPREDDPKICNSYDLIYDGLEMLSGSQRIHKADMITQALKDRGDDPAGFEFYINAFRAGAPPHAGWSFGLERLTMKLTGQLNIREASMFPRDMERLTP